MILRPNFIYLAIFLIFQIWLSGQWHMFLWCDKLITKIYFCFTWTLKYFKERFTCSETSSISHWCFLILNSTEKGNKRIGYICIKVNLHVSPGWIPTYSRWIGHKNSNYSSLWWSVKNELRSLTARGKKPLCSLVVQYLNKVNVVLLLSSSKEPPEPTKM